MPQTIEVPGVGELEFPDEMGDDQIAEAIQKNFGSGAVGNSQADSFFKPGGEINWDSPDFAKHIDKMQRDYEMQRAVGRGMEAGTELTGALAEAIGIQPQEREKSIEERMTPGLSPEKAALERERLMIEDEGVPAALRLGAAAHTGLAKGAQLPNTILHSLYRIGRSLPGAGIAREIGEDIGEMVLPPGVNQAIRETREGLESSNDEYFQNLNRWEQWMSERDAMLGGGGFGTQVTEGTFRGFAELPVQLLSGLPARGAATAEGMIRGIAAGAGGTAGVQTFAQELGEGASMPTAATRGATAGLITGLTTRAFGATGVESIFRKEGVTGLMNRVKRVLVEAGYEGAEEAVDQAQQELANYINKNPNKPVGDAVRDVFLAGSVGTLLGGGVGAVSTMGGPDASQNQKAAALHGDVRPQAEQGPGQVPAEEGGTRVQSDAELDYLRAEREGMDETNTLLKDAIASEGATDMVVPQPGVGFDENSPFFGRIAWFSPRTGKINIDPMLLNEELKGIPKDQRKEKVQRILNEEVVHAFTDIKDADDFASMSSRVERALGRRIYTGRWSGILPEGKTISNRNLGFEMMRRRIQRINDLTPTEMVGVARKERWKLETYDILDRAIGKAREYVGTTASREGRAQQLAILDRTQKKLQQARQATIEAGVGDTDDIEDLGALAKTDRVKELLTTISQGGTFPNNSQAVDAGLQAESIDDLDAMAEAKRTIVDRLKVARQNKDFGAMAGLVGPNQFLREAIEAATNAGSQRVDKRVTDAEKAKPNPKLDWRKNPEVKAWLQQNGQEVGITIDEEQPVGALSRRIRSSDQMGDYTEHVVTPDGKLERAEGGHEAYADKLLNRLNGGRPTSDGPYMFMAKNGYQRAVVDDESIIVTEAWNKIPDKVLKNLKDTAIEQGKQLIIEDYQTGKGRLIYDPSDAQGALSKAAQKRIEDLRKIRELEMGKQGRHPKVEPAGAAMSKRLADTPVTPESIDEIANEILGQKSVQTPKTTKEGGMKAKIKGAPSFQEFLNRVRTRHGTAVQPGQIKEAWEDAVWKKLENATGAELNAMVDNLGLRNKVFGQFVGGSTKGGDIHRIARTGDIADASAAKQQTGPIDKAQKRAERLLDRAADLDAKAEIAKTQQEAAGLRQRAQQLRTESENLTKLVESGQGMPQQESLFPGVESTQATYTRGTEGKGPQREAAGGESPTVRARKRAISVIGAHLINERGSMKDGLNRKEITPDDVRWNEQGNEIYVAKRGDTDDLDKLGMELTRGAGSNAATKRVTGGGKVLQQVEALPRSATKRVVALLDNVTKKVHLVSAYRDGRRGPVFRDPFSVTGEHRPLSELKRFRPVFSIPLDMPVQNFHQTFDSVKQFSERFYNQVHTTAKQVGWRGMETEPFIEGTAGLEGEGGLFQGPNADLARIAEGMARGAREMGIDITEGEARAAYDAFSAVEVSTDAEHVIKRLAEKAKKNELKPKDWLLIQAMTKINDALLRARAQDLADQKADAKAAGIPFEPNEVSTGMYQETLNKIYDLAKRNETQSSFVTSAKGQFAERLRTARPFGAAETGPSETSRELTMLGRRPPTDISQAEPGQPEVPTGAEGGPAGLRAEQEPRFRRRAPSAEPTDYGQMVPRPLQSIPKKVLRRGNVLDYTQQHRPEGGALIETGGRRAEPTSYPATGEPWIGEGAPPTTKYDVPPEKKAEIERYINDRMDVIEAQYEQMQSEPQEPQPEQTGMEFGEGTGERNVDLPREESEGELPIGALRTRRPRSLGQLVSNTLSDFGSFYDKWMVDRLKDYGGPISRIAADGFNWIIDREKQLYGGLTPLLDRARRLAGGIEPNRSNTVSDYVRDIPRRARESANAIRAANWLNGLRVVSPGAATARTVDAVEGRLPVPPWAQPLIDAVQAANMEIGLLLQPVVPGFRATGRFQRNFTSLGYDIIRDGGGELWQAWTRGVAEANRMSGATVADVRRDFTEMKRLLDDPITSGAALEQINQDLARRYPRAITHVRSRTGWQQVIHSDMFGYLENAARRATHVRAFREQFPNDQQGRQAFAQLMEALRREMPAEAQRDLDALVRSMHGHPTDDYSGGWQDFTRMGPQQTMGQVMRMANTTVNNVLSKMVLTGQMFTQTGELISGSTPIFLGYRQYMRAAARARQMYNMLETMGAVNRVMHDYTWNPNAPIRSSFRLAGNVISKFSAQNFLNEVQEAMAAATARVTAEDIQTGNMNDWQRRMLPDTFSKMGFTQAEVGRMMQGDPELLDMFQRRAAAFLTGGNKAIAEGSRLGANRLFNSIFRFQTYPMIKANQTRKVLTDLFDQTRTPQQRWRSAESAARFIAGNTLQGALTVAITSLAYGGLGGLKIKWEEAKDEPLKFMADVFLASVSGPAYMVYQGLRQKGMMGVGEQAARAAFPYAITRELMDMGQGNGQYRDKDTFQKIGRFLASKTPGTRAIGTALAAFGLGDESRELDIAISALNRWRRDNLGYTDRQESLENDERKEFRMNVKKAIEALKDGDMDGYQQAWMDAVMDRGVQSVSDSLNSLKVLVGPDGKPLTDDEKDALIKHIGVEAFERLEYYDLMLDRAADGVVLPP